MNSSDTSEKRLPGTEPTDGRQTVVTGNDIVMPIGVNVPIDNADRSTWRYVKRYKLRVFISFIAAICVWGIFVAVFLATHVHGSLRRQIVLFGIATVPAIFAFISWYGDIYEKFESALLEQFALSNGYSFNKNGVVDETYAAIFRVKGTHRASNVITGSYAGRPLRLFECSGLLDSDSRHSHFYHNTVIELEVGGRLPNLMMVNVLSGFMEFLDVAYSVGMKNTINLEGDFNQHFKLFASSEDTVEALVIFSPDIMALMEDESQRYTVEFVGDRIYIYVKNDIATTEQLNQTFTLAKKLLDKVSPIASRLKNDSATVTMATPVTVVSKLRPSTKKTVRKILISLAIVCLFQLLLGLIITIYRSNR